MRYLFTIACFLPLFCVAQSIPRADNSGLLIYVDSLTQALRAGKLDTARAGDIGAGTKTVVTTKRGSARADTFSIPSNGVVDLQPWLTTNGFTSMLIIGAIPYRNPGGGNNAAQLYISAWTATTVTLNVTVQNTAIVQILGINVLSGLPLVTPAVGVVKAYLSFVAYQ